MAARAAGRGRAARRSSLQLILTDAEMPEMDGYVLTRCIKSDPRFAGIPVVMHSSLSSEANRAMGKSVGVDAYVAKFDPRVLADTLRPLHRSTRPQPRPITGGNTMSDALNCDFWSWTIFPRCAASFATC